MTDDRERELSDRVQDLTSVIAELQAGNSRLWHERNAAVEGGWHAVKSLYSTRQAKDNDKLRSENDILKKRLASLGHG